MRGETMSNLPLIVLEEYDRLACLKALETFGARKQMIKAIEELSELSCELARAVNQDAHTDFSEAIEQADRICEETADAIAMLFQVVQLYGAESVRQHLRSKMQRLNRRLDATCQEETK